MVPDRGHEQMRGRRHQGQAPRFTVQPSRTADSPRCTGRIPAINTIRGCMPDGSFILLDVHAGHVRYLLRSIRCEARLALGNRGATGRRCPAPRSMPETVATAVHHAPRRQRAVQGAHCRGCKYVVGRETALVCCRRRQRGQGQTNSVADVADPGGQLSTVVLAATKTARYRRHHRAGDNKLTVHVFRSDFDAARNDQGLAVWFLHMTSCGCCAYDAGRWMMDESRDHHLQPRRNR